MNDTPLSNLIDNLALLNPSDVASGGVKTLIVVALLLYTVFAVVMIRQIQLMNRTIRTRLSRVIKLIAFIHLLASIGLVILALIVL